MSSCEFDNLTIEEKIGQLFFIGIPGPELDAETRGLIERIRPGGVCLFARNIREAGQTRKLLDDIHRISNVRPFLSLDQEGGLVDRLRRVVTPMPAADLIRSIEQAERFGSLIAEIIRILGFNMDFAPVIDVVDQRRSSFSNGLHSRAFGSTADEATELAGAFLTGITNGGVLGCLKHFPGLGASDVDSHEEMPAVGVEFDELRCTDLIPYRRLLSDHKDVAVMVAHAAYPKLDLQEADQNGTLLPSSLSFNFVSKLLRHDLGFNGVAITDDLEMGAVVKNFGIGESCKRAILGGEDMLAICASPDAIIEAFAAVHSSLREGAITESRVDESLGRIAALKDRISEPLPFERNRLDELSRQVVDFIASLK
jgi:beta-N-acetylhexosaminidase